MINAGGAGNPCAECGMSHRNSVHKNVTQFGYHAHVEQPEEKIGLTIEERLRKLLDEVNEESEMTWVANRLREILEEVNG